MTDLKPEQDWCEALAGEMLLFGLLGKLLYAQPGWDWLKELAREGVFSDVPFAAGRPAVQSGLKRIQSGLAGIHDPAAFQRIQEDHLHLFIGVGPVLAAPWESVYFSDQRLVFQEQTLQVRAWYQRFGLQSEKLHREPDDHIGLEFSFISFLAGQGLEACEAQDLPRLQALLAAQRQFLSEHLLRWAPHWCRLVSTHARTDFYRGVADLALGALQETAERLGAALSQGAPA